MNFVMDICCGKLHYGVYSECIRQGTLAEAKLSQLINHQHLDFRKTLLKVNATR